MIPTLRRMLLLSAALPVLAVWSIGCERASNGGSLADAGSADESAWWTRPPGSDSGSSLGEVGGGPVVPGAQDNGLEIRKWLIRDDVDVIALAFAQYAEEVPLSERGAASLARNGLRFWRVPNSSLAAMRESFGGTTVDHGYWFGQVVEWSELHGRLLGSARGVAVAGRVRTFDDGVFSMLIRSWTVRTDQGPRIHFEMVPFFTHRGGYRRAGRGSDLEGEVFAELLAQHPLERGYAYLLTCESPGLDWAQIARGGGVEHGLGGGRGDEDLAIPDGGGVRGSFGPPGWFGPEIGGPWTVGEALFRGTYEVANRAVVVIVPHIPERLYPEEFRSIGEGAAARHVESPVATGTAHRDFVPRDPQSESSDLAVQTASLRSGQAGRVR